MRLFQDYVQSVEYHKKAIMSENLAVLYSKASLKKSVEKIAHATTSDRQFWGRKC